MGLTQKQAMEDKIVTPVISIKKLSKVFSGKVHAVDGIDLEIAAGDIFGFLGPNGAGKTTTLRMLATLFPIDSGEALVAGFDVKRQPQKVRQHIGYVSQLGGADSLATGREDLILQGQLYGMGMGEARERAGELIKVLDLIEFADRRVNTYSGGQKRRLHVALGIMHRPEVLFLDEPTTGLDPQNRANLWEQIRQLKNMGTTVFLTTHYLEEADVLSDRLAIMDHGKIVAEGTSRELKQQIAGDSITFSLKNKDQSNEKARKLFQSQPYIREMKVEDEEVHLYVKEGAVALPELIRLLDKENIQIKSVTLSEPTLDDVFLRQTGRSLRDTAAAKTNGGRR
jgi:ABC-2 type transport system ATP-binding protein